MDWVQFGITAVTFVALVVGAIFYIRSEVARARASELHDLAETRGERIADLKEEIREMKAQWSEETKALRGDIAKLQGQIEAYQSIKAEEIAVEVARLIGGEHA